MKEKQTSQLLEKESLNEALQDHVEWIRNVIREKFGINPSKVGLEDEIPLDFIPQDNCGHSRWEGAEEHYDDLYWWSPEEWLQHLDIEKEYSFSDNGKNFHEAGETMIDFFERDGRQFQYYVDVYSGKEYGETWEWYEGVSLFKSPDFQKELSKIEEEDFKRWKTRLNS